MALSLGLGLGLSFAPSKGGGGYPFKVTESILGAGGLDWSLYDAAAIDRMWQEATGQTPANVNSPVGLIVGREKQKAKTFAQVMAGQPELFVPGATIDASTAPATSSEFPAGTVVVGGDGSATSRRDLSVPVTAGRNYLIRFSVAGGNGQVSSRAGASQGSTTYYDTVVGNSNIVVTAAGPSLWLRWYIQSGIIRTITDISIKEVPAHYASQAVSNQRGVLQADGVKYDGVAQNHLTDWFAQAGANTLIWQGTMPAGAGEQRLMMGCGGNAVSRAFLGLDGAGRLGVGVGSLNQSAQSGGSDRRGSNIFVLASWDGTTVKLFSDEGEIFSGPQSGTAITNIPMRLGANNADSVPQAFSPATMKRAGMGKMFVSNNGDAQRIRAEWLAAA